MHHRLAKFSRQRMPEDKPAKRLYATEAEMLINNSDTKPDNPVCLIFMN